MFFAVVLLCSGCRAAYLTRLACEEMRFLHSAAPATDLLASADNPERRHALETLLDVRAFAGKSGLEVGGSYREVADVSSAAPFHVVTAAYADRLEPYTWWYPIVGAIPYRGYFDQAEADGFAATLQGEGLDTLVVQASAYSTLGWFDDPLPSNVLDRGAGAVVITVLHELTHQTFFAPGQVAFNETLATAVSYRLGETYYREKGDDVRADKVHAAREAFVARSDVLDAAAARLQSFFGRAKTESWPRDRVLAERETVYTEVLADIARADPEFAASLKDGKLDNASFLAAHRYASNARAIDAYLGRYPDVKSALAALKELSVHSKDLDAAVSASVAAHQTAAELHGIPARRPRVRRFRRAA